jgi:DNA-binding NarL/FixJ family response regulator
MNYMGTGISIDDAQAGKQPLAIGELRPDNANRAHAAVGAKVDRFIAVIEGRTFMRDVIRRSMQSAFSLSVVAYSAASELEPRLCNASAELVILSLMDASKDACASALKVLAELVPSVPIVVIAFSDDANLARTALGHGAKGYIPCTMGFDMAVEAVRFVLVGGTYVPTDCLLPTRWPDLPKSQISQPSSSLTARELAVVRAIRQGKPNKVIAYDLNMAESTVKVHVNNLMRKLGAKNRTEVAIRTQTEAA